MRRLVIGLAGQIGSGKSMVGAYLVERHGFRMVNFADELKAEVSQTLHRTLTAYLLETGRLGAEPTPESSEGYRLAWPALRDRLIHQVIYTDRTRMTRALLQEWGTELRRAEEDGYWIRKWLMTVEAARPLRPGTQSGGSRIVACDTRFRNEAEAIKMLGGRVAQIRRPALGPPGDHVSEHGLDGWDFDDVFDNTGSPADLHGEVEAWIVGLIARAPLAPAAPSQP